MTDSTKHISRRDWFRLRLESREPLLGTSTKQSNVEALAPIEHPPNHDGMDLSELPPLREALLNRDQVELLFGDIEKHAVDIQLFQRSKVDSRGTASQTPSLASAKEAILSSSVSRMQIRYRWNNSLWIDTVETLDDGYRLVRIAHSGR